MEQPVARDLFQSEAAGIMLVEPQQSSNNSLCSHPVASNTSQSGITCHKRHKDRFWLQTRSQKLIPKMKPFLASPNETIEAVSQKLKLKMASVKRDTNCPKRKGNVAAPKKNSQWMCPTTLLQMLAQPRRMSSIKFHSSTSEARDSLHASSCKNRRSYTVFSVSCWHCSAASSWSLEGSMCQLMDTPSWSSLWQGICFRAKLPESCL